MLQTGKFSAWSLANTADISRTRDLLTAMSKRAPSQVEFIYVDEAQEYAKRNVQSGSQLNLAIQ